VKQSSFFSSKQFECTESIFYNLLSHDVSHNVYAVASKITDDPFFCCSRCLSDRQQLFPSCAFKVAEDFIVLFEIKIDMASCFLCSQVSTSQGGRLFQPDKSHFVHFSFKSSEESCENFAQKESWEVWKKR
jgi:hypothetical protein